jgi:predicted nuclease of restriction endonuclease-like (RecB) superfamily
MRKNEKTSKGNVSIRIALFKEIRALILAARTVVVRNVDTIQVITNFEIGRRIVEYEQKGQTRAQYGKQLINVLSEKLTSEFGQGFSDRNLRNMRKFYLLYVGQVKPIWQTPSAKSGRVLKSQTPSDRLTKAESALNRFSLSWSQYVFLIGIKDKAERNFYEIESANNGWSLPELTRQFNTGLYERLALSRNKKGIRELSKKGQVITKPDDLLKEPYVLEFLGLDEKIKYSESDLESAIISKLEHFLLELGKGFLFEARQKRFTFDESHFFVDMVFYNRLLQSASWPTTFTGVIIRILIRNVF